MIEARQVSYGYPGGIAPALEDVSVEIGPEEFVGVVGPNGSGKSTLARLLKGLLVPRSGEVRVNGLSTRDDGLRVRGLVGLVFQNPNSQIVNSIVEHEVAFGPENQGLHADEIRLRVQSALSSVGLEGQGTAECHSLSMANKQRVALAAVLAMRPEYLILDEPTAWLEPKARLPLLRLIREWTTQHNVGLLLVTHRMEEALLCDRLYGVLEGRMEASGRPGDVLENQNARTRLGLDMPESMTLAKEFQAAGLPVSVEAGLDGMADALCRS